MTKIFDREEFNKRQKCDFNKDVSNKFRSFEHRFDPPSIQSSVKQMKKNKAHNKNRRTNKKQNDLNILTIISACTLTIATLSLVVNLKNR